jgi:hypothetical protein
MSTNERDERFRVVEPPEATPIRRDFSKGTASASKPGSPGKDASRAHERPEAFEGDAGPAPLQKGDGQPPSNDGGPHWDREELERLRHEGQTGGALGGGLGGTAASNGE